MMKLEGPQPTCNLKLTCHYKHLHSSSVAQILLVLRSDYVVQKVLGYIHVYVHHGGIDNGGGVNNYVLFFDLITIFHKE